MKIVIINKSILLKGGYRWSLLVIDAASLKTGRNLMLTSKHNISNCDVELDLIISFN